MKYNIQTNSKGCEYLFASSNVFKSALTFFSGKNDGDIEKSFTDLHLAWEHLWQADRRASLRKTRQNPEIINGDEFNGKIHRFSLSDYLNEIESLKEKAFIEPNNFFEEYARCSLSQNINWAFDNKINHISQDSQLHIENENLNPKNKKNFVLNYDYRFAAPFFRKIHHVNHPAYLNINFFRNLRNNSQHGFIESATKSSNALITLLLPYFEANIRNYLEAFSEVSHKVSENCLFHDDLPKCARNKIPKLREIALSLTLPQPLEGYELIASGIMESGKHNNWTSELMADVQLYKLIMLELNKFENKGKFKKNTLVNNLVDHRSELSIKSNSEDMSLLESLTNLILKAGSDVTRRKTRIEKRRIEEISVPRNLKLAISKKEKHYQKLLLSSNGLFKALTEKTIVRTIKGSKLTEDDFNLYLKWDSSINYRVKKTIELKMSEYKAGSIKEIVDYLNQLDFTDFPFIIQTGDVKAILDDIRKNNESNIINYELTLFEKTKFHYSLISYIKENYSTKEDFKEICRSPKLKI